MPQNLSQPDLNEVSVEQARLENARLQDVVMLVDNLLRNEETTIGMIVDCLYDIGSVRLINQKIEPQILQDVTKPIARLSKPAVRVIALRWLKKNCPVLLANWLYSKVKFEQSVPAPPSDDLQEEIQHELDENIAAPIAENPLNPTAAMPTGSPLSSTPYPPHAAPPIEALLNTANDKTMERREPDPPLQALVPVPSSASAISSVEPTNPSGKTLDTGIVPLSEYNRAIAQLKYRDNELRRVRAQLRISMVLVVGAAIAMGGLLLSFPPDAEFSQPNTTDQLQVEDE